MHHVGAVSIVRSKQKNRKILLQLQLCEIFFANKVVLVLFVMMCFISGREGGRNEEGKCRFQSAWTVLRWSAEVMSDLVLISRVSGKSKAHFEHSLR